MLGLDPSLLPFQVLFAEWLGLICALALLALLVFVLVALWMYRDAESRRMNGTLWVVLLLLAALLFNFVGGAIVVVVYLLVASSHPVGGYPYGYGPAPAYPPYTGYAAPPPPPPAPATQPTGLPTTCRNCGAPLAPGAAYCARCGAKV